MTDLAAATSAMNDWRTHSFAELAPYEVPEGERRLTAGVLAAVVQELQPDPAQSWSIFNPPRAQELIVRGAGATGDDADAPRPADLAALVDAWLADAPSDCPLQLELPNALRGAPQVLTARGFAPVSTFAVRRGDGRGASPSEWASKPGRTLRQPTADDREGITMLLGELHLADMDAASGAWPHPRLREHLADYAENLTQVPVLGVVAEYFGLLAGVASLAAPGTVPPRTSRERELYVQFTAVTRRLRAGGIGAALLAELDARARAAGAEMLAVDFAGLNPESGPFWLRQGFRPLTTMWRRQ